jgi:hypothetical protein
MEKLSEKRRINNTVSLERYVKHEHFAILHTSLALMFFYCTQIQRCKAYK